MSQSKATGGGGGTVDTGVDGLLAYYDGAGTALNDATTLFWDDSNSRLGIGTDTPSESLEVSGGNISITSSDNAYLSIDNTQTNGDEWQILNGQNGADSTLQFKNIDQSKVVMLLDESGNVGIGTVAPSASTKLHVSGSGAVYQKLESTDNVVSQYYMGNKTGSDGAITSLICYNGSDSVGSIHWDRDGDDAQASLIFETQTSGPAFAERMRISHDGNVGIGTVVPSDYYYNDLVVNAGDEGGITIVDTSSGQSALAFGDGTSTTERYKGRVLYDHSTDVLRLGGGGQVPVNITDTSLGIGMSPTSNLQVLLGDDEVVSYDSAAQNLFQFWKEGSTEEARMNMKMGGVLKVHIRANGDSYFKGGNVGIGRTPSSFALEVEGKGYFRDAPSSAGDSDYQIIIEDNATAYGSSPTAGITFRGIYTGTSVTDLAGLHAGKENTTDANYAGFLAFTTHTQGSNPSEKMRINSTGYVGVGCTPTAGLHVAMSQTNGHWLAKFATANTAQPYGVNIREPDSATTGYPLLSIDSSSATHFRVDSVTGNVGIGVSDPDSELEINGQIKIVDGTQGADKVLTSDAAGLATWEDAAGGAGATEITSGTSLTSTATANHIYTLNDSGLGEDYYLTLPSASAAEGATLRFVIKDSNGNSLYVVGAGSSPEQIWDNYEIINGSMGSVGELQTSFYGISLSLTSDGSAWYGDSAHEGNWTT